jgi:hypothetical protein
VYVFGKLVLLRVIVLKRRSIVLERTTDKFEVRKERQRGKCNKGYTRKLDIMCIYYIFCRLTLKELLFYYPYIGLEGLSPGLDGSRGQRSSLQARSQRG